MKVRSGFPDFTDKDAVIAFAKELAKRHPRFVQYVVKHPSRDNYNITMQIDNAIEQGAEIIWQSKT